MNILTFYSGTSALLSSLVLTVLLLTDVTYISNKVTHIISLFVILECVKYFVISLAPDVDRILNISSLSSTHTHSGQKIPLEKKTKKVLKGAFLIFIVTTLFHIIIILLGASVLDNFEDTLKLSVLLSIVSFLPLCFYHGPNLALAVLFNSSPSNISDFEAVLRQSLFLTLFGAWLGAFALPLDWDRPWQKWPIPCLFGAVSGYFVSHAVTLIKGLFRSPKSVPV